MFVKVRVQIIKGQRYLMRRRIRRVINKTTRLIFSDLYPISTDSEMDKFLAVVWQPTNPIKQLEYYLAVQVATVNIGKSYKPITIRDIEYVQNELYKAIDEASSTGNSIEFFDLKIELAELHAKRCLKLASAYFEHGRESYKNDPHSQDGRRYFLEKKKKGPL